jgi:hypothetical protein
MWAALKADVDYSTGSGSVYRVLELLRVAVRRSQHGLAHRDSNVAEFDGLFRHASRKLDPDAPLTSTNAAVALRASDDTWDIGLERIHQ